MFLWFAANDKYPIVSHNIRDRFKTNENYLNVFLKKFKFLNFLLALPNYSKCELSALDWKPYSNCNLTCASYVYKFENDWTEETYSSKFDIFCDNEHFEDLNCLVFGGIFLGEVLSGILVRSNKMKNLFLSKNEIGK